MKLKYVVTSILAMCMLFGCSKESPTPSKEVEQSSNESREIELSNHAYDRFAGDWYGVIMFDEGSGECSESLAGIILDCCCIINLDEDGKGSMVLWDELGNKTNVEDQTMDGEVEYATKDGIGYLKFVDCWFLDENNITTDIYPAEAFEGFEDFDDGIIMNGIYTAPNEEGHVEYFIFMRPWGMHWDDMDQDLWPYHYTTWYLDQIKHNESMPEAIDVE